MGKNRKKRNRSENYLDLIPVHNEKFRWNKDEKGNITIYIDNKGIFNRIAQKLFGKPEVSQVHLEEMGNFIWPLLDGKHSVYEIAGLVKEEFGEKAEPLYERLVTYMRTVESYDFIQMRKK